MPLDNEDINPKLSGQNMESTQRGLEYSGKALKAIFLTKQVVMCVTENPGHR